MKVSVDQRQCIGNGVCAEIAPEVFRIDHGVAFVCDHGQLVAGDAAVDIPECLAALGVEAAEQCPTECIYLEP